MDLMLLKPGNESLCSDPLFLSSSLNGEEEYQGCIELVSMFYGMKQQMTTDVSNAARTSGRPLMNDITAIKYLDQTSTNLYEACLTAKPIGEGDNVSKIYLLRNAQVGDYNESSLDKIMTIELTNAVVSSVDSQSHPNDMPTEQFTLNFTDIKWINNVAGNHSKLAKSKQFGWSLAKNRPL